MELISTGGTRKTLADAGLSVCDIAEVTGFPEILDGRVKTLHPRMHAGILAMRDNPEHMPTLGTQYRHRSIWSCATSILSRPRWLRPGSSHEEIVENIDVGGPSMIRAAAKNYHDVAVVTDPNQYGMVLAELRERKGRPSLATRESWLRRRSPGRRLTIAPSVYTSPTPLPRERGSEAGQTEWPKVLDLHFELLRPSLRGKPAPESGLLR